MFPSSGYFKGFNCPFFTSGLCDRPNCHYRHVEEEKPLESVHLSLNQKQSYLAILNKAHKQLNRAITVPTIPTVTLNNENNQNSRVNINVNLLPTAAPQYIPTPIPVLEQLKLHNSDVSSNEISDRITFSDIAQLGILPKEVKIISKTEKPVEVTINNETKLNPSSIPLTCNSSATPLTSATTTLSSFAEIKTSLDSTLSTLPLSTSLVSSASSTLLSSSNDKKIVIATKTPLNCSTKRKADDINLKSDLKIPTKKFKSDYNADKNTSNNKIESKKNKLPNIESHKIDKKHDSLLVNDNQCNGKLQKGKTSKASGEIKSLKSDKKVDIDGKSSSSSSPFVSENSSSLNKISSSSSDKTEPPQSSSSSSLERSLSLPASSSTSSSQKMKKTPSVSDSLLLSSNNDCTDSCTKKNDDNKKNISNNKNKINTSHREKNILNSHSSSKDKKSDSSSASSSKKLKHKIKDADLGKTTDNNNNNRDSNKNNKSQKHDDDVRANNHDQSKEKVGKEKNINLLEKFDLIKLNMPNNPIVQNCLKLLEEEINKKSLPHNQIKDMKDNIGDSNDHNVDDYNDDIDKDLNNNIKTNNVPTISFKKRIAHSNDIELKQIPKKQRLGMQPPPQQVLLERMKYFHDASLNNNNNNNNNNSNNNSNINNNKINNNYNNNKISTNGDSNSSCVLKDQNNCDMKNLTSNNRHSSSTVSSASSSFSVMTSASTTAATSSTTTSTSRKRLEVWGGGMYSPTHNTHNNNNNTFTNQLNIDHSKTNRSIDKSGKINSTSTSSQQQQQKNKTASTSVVPVRGSAVSIKGTSRVAHKPSEVVTKRPIPVPVVTKQPLPYELRQNVLNNFIDLCLKIYDTESDAFERALSEEETLAKSSGSRQIYKSHAVTTRFKLTREGAGTNDETSPTNDINNNVNNNALSHRYVLGGRLAQETSYTFNRCGKTSSLPTVITSCELYKRLQLYKTSYEQLLSNGFPVRDLETKKIIIMPSERAIVKKPSSNPNEKICCRCGKGFIVLKNGNYLTKEKCFYHWGHSYRRRVAGSWDHQYRCCQGDLSTKGCEVAEYHVHEENKINDLSGYAETAPCKSQKDEDYGVYALDCEMVYTTGGCELARVTVVDQHLKLVLDELVLPENKIVDYNSRFSGINEGDLRTITKTLQDIQAKLLSIFNDKTILIGHSLENDMVALKMLHTNIVDTSIVFPHKTGPPYKRALRNLSTEILKKIIQDGVDGHDSKEDADTCMELMLWKVKEDMKKSYRNY